MAQQQEIKDKCWLCDGLGHYFDYDSGRREVCITCKGSGIYKEMWGTHPHHQEEISRISRQLMVEATAYHRGLRNEQ